MHPIPAVIAALVLALSGNAPACLAQDFPPGPSADRATYEAFLQALDFDREQRVIAEFLYSDYVAALRDEAAEVDRAAIEAGRDRVEKAFAGQIFVAPDELRRIRIAVEEVNRAAVPASIDLLSDLLEQTLSLVAPKPGHAVAVADFRRRVFLAPRRGHEQDQAYAGDGVDVAALLVEAASAGGELEGVALDRLHRVRDTYVVSMDAHLRNHAAAEDDDRANETIARIRRDEPARQELELRRIERWREFRAITERAVLAIADIAEESGGPAARQRWEARARAASYPWLVGRTIPEQELDWIRSHLRDESSVSQAETIIEQYRAQIDPLVREAIALVERARREAHIVLHARMDMSSLPSLAREIHQELLRNSGARAQAAATATGRLDALLTEGQRAQFRADLAAAAYGRR